MNTKSVYKSAAGKQEIMALYDAVLAHWPVTHQTFTLPTRHGDTFVIASGDPSAPPLFLLHGAASNAVSWVADIPAYSQHFRVFTPDLPGEPGKSSENRPSWQGPAFAEWLQDLLDGFGIAQTSLLGISQGGWTAIRFATLFPERVSQLVLLASGGVMPTRSSFIFKAVAYSFFGRWGSNQIIRLVNNDLPVHPEAQKFLQAIYTHFNTRVEKEYQFTDDELRLLSMPVLYIGGTQDALFDTQAAASRLGSLLPNLQTILLPNTGHALINLADQILPFLKK